MCICNLVKKGIYYLIIIAETIAIVNMMAGRTAVAVLKFYLKTYLDIITWTTCGVFSLENEVYIKT